MDISLPEFFNHSIFVNFCLNILHGRKLPSYCYYDDDYDLNLFYNNITETDKIKIYVYLTEKDYINPEIISQIYFITNFRNTIESFCSNN